MKHIRLLAATAFTILCAACLCAPIRAQQNHLNFLDIPIDGTLETFVQELQVRGFTFDKSQGYNIAQLHTIKNGQQIDYFVVASEDAQHVYRVTMLTQHKYNWKALRNEYMMYKKMLTKQYGEPESVEIFMEPYNTRKKLRRHQLQALMEGRAHWNSAYEAKDETGTTLGYVQTEIAPIGNLVRVTVTYEDASNTEKYSIR